MWRIKTVEKLGSDFVFYAEYRGRLRRTFLKTLASISSSRRYSRREIVASQVHRDGARRRVSLSRFDAA